MMKTLDDVPDPYTLAVITEIAESFCSQLAKCFSHYSYNVNSWPTWLPRTVARLQIRSDKHTSSRIVVWFHERHMKMEVWGEDLFEISYADPDFNIDKLTQITLRELDVHWPVDLILWR